MSNKTSPKLILKLFIIAALFNLLPSHGFADENNAKQIKEKNKIMEVDWENFFNSKKQITKNQQHNSNTISEKRQRALAFVKSLNGDCSKLSSEEWLAYTRIFYSAKYFKAAVSSVQCALEIDPNNANALFYSGYFLAGFQNYEPQKSKQMLSLVERLSLKKGNQRLAVLSRVAAKDIAPKNVNQAIYQDDIAELLKIKPDYNVKEERIIVRAYVLHLTYLVSNNRKSEAKELFEDIKKQFQGGHEFLYHHYFLTMESLVDDSQKTYAQEVNNHTGLLKSASKLREMYPMVGSNSVPVLLKLYSEVGRKDLMQSLSRGYVDSVVKSQFISFDKNDKTALDMLLNAFIAYQQIEPAQKLFSEVYLPLARKHQRHKDAFSFGTEIFYHLTISGKQNRAKQLEQYLIQIVENKQLDFDIEAKQYSELAKAYMFKNDIPQSGVNALRCMNSIEKRIFKGLSDQHEIGFYCAKQAYYTMSVMGIDGAEDMFKTASYYANQLGAAAKKNLQELVRLVETEGVKKMKNNHKEFSKH